jgi:hypothetical protein
MKSKHILLMILALGISGCDLYNKKDPEAELAVHKAKLAEYETELAGYFKEKPYSIWIINNIIPVTEEDGEINYYGTIIDGLILDPVEAKRQMRAWAPKVGEKKHFMSGNMIDLTGHDIPDEALISHASKMWKDWEFFYKEKKKGWPENHFERIKELIKKIHIQEELIMNAIRQQNHNVNR